MYEAPPPIDPIRCNDPAMQNVWARLDTMQQIIDLQAVELRRLRYEIKTMKGTK